ncbi:MAG: multiheme c-type cytochrome [Halofilum sp. (in: g-proteobacteria)]|nr:multiheme c-type cytochrome [Halofilum sp. (in: g-proteobacteria)]
MNGHGGGLRAMLLVLAAAGAGAAEPPLPDESGAVHMGAATCAGSDCHSASRSLAWTNVLQREFDIWAEHDAHSDAYADLRGERAGRIAARLGIDRPTRDRTCLRCHSDYVPPARRGENYAIGDGVACEACHGGAENYLGSHSSGTATRAENLANGMYPTERPTARARLCLSCHLGARGRAHAPPPQRRRPSASDLRARYLRGGAPGAPSRGPGLPPAQAGQLRRARLGHRPGRDGAPAARDPRRPPGQRHLALPGAEPFRVLRLPPRRRGRQSDPEQRAAHQGRRAADGDRDRPRVPPGAGAAAGRRHRAPAGGHRP